MIKIINNQIIKLLITLEIIIFKSNQCEINFSTRFPYMCRKKTIILCLFITNIFHGSVGLLLFFFLFKLNPEIEKINEKYKLNIRLKQFLLVKSVKFTYNVILNFASYSTYIIIQN